VDPKDAIDDKKKTNKKYFVRKNLLPVKYLKGESIPIQLEWLNRASLVVSLKW